MNLQLLFYSVLIIWYQIEHLNVFVENFGNLRNGLV